MGYICQNYQKGEVNIDFGDQMENIDGQQNNYIGPKDS